MRPGLSEALRKDPGPDVSELSEFVARHQSGCAVLALPMQMEEGPSDISPDALCAMLTHLRGMFDYVVADLGIYLDDLTLRVMGMANVVLVVGVQNLASVRNIRRFLEYANQEDGLSDKVRLVLNRHISQGELSAGDMEKTLGIKIFWEIPNDYLATLEAINAGTPLTDFAPKSAVSKSLAGLALALSGQAKTWRKSKFFGFNIFGAKGKG